MNARSYITSSNDGRHAIANFTGQFTAALMIQRATHHRCPQKQQRVNGQFFRKNLTVSQQTMCENKQNENHSYKMD